MSFSNSLPIVNKQRLANSLGVKMVDFHDRYLGLPVLIRKSKNEAFSYVKDKLWKKLQSWRGSRNACKNSGSGAPYVFYTMLSSSQIVL